MICSTVSAVGAGDAVPSNFFGEKFGQIWLDLGEIWLDLGKIKILHLKNIRSPTAMSMVLLIVN